MIVLNHQVFPLYFHGLESSQRKYVMLDKQENTVNQLGHY